MSGQATPFRLGRAVAAATTIAYSIVLVLFGVQGSDLVRTIVGAFPMLAVVALVAWDKWLWKWPIVLKVHGRPNISGSWKGEIYPARAEELPPGSPSSPIGCLVQISQSFWSLHVSLRTKESKSASWSESLVRVANSDSYKLSYFFSNQPGMKVRHRSLQHDGAAVFAWEGASPPQIEGIYFNDRRSTGDIKLVRVDRELDPDDIPG